MTPSIKPRQAALAPLSMGSPRQEYQRELPFTSLEDLPDSGIPSVSPALADGFFTTEPPGKAKEQYLTDKIGLKMSLI